MTIDIHGAQPAKVLAPTPNEECQGEHVLNGRYRVGAEIGFGGVGIVYKGVDIQLDRAIAIKILREKHKTEPGVMRRYLKEAMITSRLQHPGIVAVHEVGWAPDLRPFFVMELLSGRTLEQILNGRNDVRDDLPSLLGIFLQLCQTMAYAHTQGIIHRDLKPSNIMVGDYGIMKVMDWGLAKALGEVETPDVESVPRVRVDQRTCPSDSIGLETEMGTVFGTPAYLCPEQARGEVERVDKRADLFGLGSILCKILTGQPAYTGNSIPEIYQRALVADTSEAIARMNVCGAPLDLISLAKWCLAADPADRPADAGDLVEVLTTYLHSEQRRAEQDLVRFFDLSLDMFCIAGFDGYFRRINVNFTRLLGYTAAELTSRPFIDFVHPDDQERTAAEVVRLSAGEQTIQFLNRYRHARGHYLWLEWSAQAVPGEQAIYAVARNVTDRIGQVKALRLIEQGLHSGSQVLI